MKRVTSPEPIEKLPQLMMAPLLLVMVSVFPLVENTALPLTTLGAVGLASAGPTVAAAKQSASASASRYLLTRQVGRRPLTGCALARPVRAPD